MLYVIVSDDVTNSMPLRAKARPQHIARLEKLRDKGKLIIAGPCPAIDAPDPGPNGFTGSVVIAEFNGIEEAKQWADSDPYVEAGVYNSVTVKPFKRVLP